MLRRQHALAAGSVLVALTGFACKDKVDATPRVVFESTLDPGTRSATQCGQNGTFFSVGSFGAPGDDEQPPAPVESGATAQQGSVSLSCSVIPEGDGFQLAAFLTLTGATGGAFRVQGHFTASGDQPNISVSLTRGGQTYTQNDCKAQYTLPNQTTAAGRSCANIVCPNAGNNSGTTEQLCEAKAQFRFENCSQ